MAEFHRKIELQSPDDLQYLVSNIRRAANEKIDKDLPPIEGEDKMRERVEELVHSYINDVFHRNAANMTINGLEPSQELIDNILVNSTSPSHHEIEEHEPFNTKLFERAKELAREEEELIEEIAAFRREIPGLVTANSREMYKQGMEGDEQEFTRREELLKEMGGARMGLGALERQEGMERNWEKGVKGLERLMRTMPETVAKKERAKRAEGVATE